MEEGRRFEEGDLEGEERVVVEQDKGETGYRSVPYRYRTVPRAFLL